MSRRLALRALCTIAITIWFGDSANPIGPGNQL